MKNFLFPILGILLLSCSRDEGTELSQNEKLIDGTWNLVKNEIRGSLKDNVLQGHYWAQTPCGYYTYEFNATTKKFIYTTYKYTTTSAPPCQYTVANNTSFSLKNAELQIGAELYELVTLTSTNLILKNYVSDVDGDGKRETLSIYLIKK